MMPRNDRFCGKFMHKFFRKAYDSLWKFTTFAFSSLIFHENAPVLRHFF